MKYFINNLILFPFKLVWDVLLIFSVIILQLCWLGLVFSICGTSIALITIFGSILAGSELMMCVLWPWMLLLYLKHPWPRCKENSEPEYLPDH